MDNALLTTIVSTGGSVVVGICGMFFTANQLGKRIDDLKSDVKELRSEFTAFRDLVNSKLSAIDIGIARLMESDLS